jgi:polyisoprenoid-binding protein YceI
MKSLFSLAMVLLSLSLFTACKNTTGEKAETSEATEVKEASGNKYAVDVTSSIINWEGSKPTGRHNGTINISEGSLSIEAGKLSGGSFVIDMNTIKDLDLPDGKRENLEAHLKGTTAGKEDDFFNVAKFPTAKFEITKVGDLLNDAEANSLIYGNLTIRDVTKQIGFKANVRTEGEMIVAHAPIFTIDRSEWGVKYGSKKFFDNLADNFVNDDIGLSIKLVAK